jgi:hypothetical protein
MLDKLPVFFIAAGFGGIVLGAVYGSPLAMKVAFFVFISALVARILKTQGGVPPA